MRTLLQSIFAISAIVALCNCGGGSGSSNTPTPASPPQVTTTPTATTTAATSSTQQAINLRSRELVTRLGKPPRLLLGLGAPEEKEVLSQQLTPDISDYYLTGLGVNTSWRGWNSPDGEYLQIRLREAARMRAVPMFTVYQIASSGDGNLSVLNDVEFMRLYWADMHRLVTLLNAYDKPVILNIEPDFWGYTHRKNADPNHHFAHVGAVYSECTNLGNSVAAMAQCMIFITKKYAPKALIGFPPSGFEDLAATEVSYMRRLGAQNADFAVMQTGDRDAGCNEVGLAPCDRIKFPSRLYWDASNTKSPNFKEHLDAAAQYSIGIGLPLLWWQVSLGVPSNQPGGKPGTFRDNKLDYFMAHTDQVIKAGGFGLVFGISFDSQTHIGSDGGQFQRLSRAYFASPATLP